MYWLMDKTRETKISLYVTLVLFAIVVIFMFVASFITSVGYNSYQTALIYNTAEAFEQTTAAKRTVLPSFWMPDTAGKTPARLPTAPWKRTSICRLPKSSRIFWS